jgi:hypothetical protein
VSAVVSETITCAPPHTRPKPINPKSPHPEIVVHIGASKQYEIGYLSYDSEALSSFPGPGLIAVIASAVSLFLLVGHTEHTSTYISLHYR